MIELRPYQHECIKVIETAQKEGTNRQLVALPTGTGKTIIFEVDLFHRTEGKDDPYAMRNLAWVRLRSPTFRRPGRNGYRLYLGRNGVINIYTDFRIPTMQKATHDFVLAYRVFYRNKRESQQVTRHPVELSWAFGLAESEARRVTGGNLTLVDKNARWRQDPATDKQIAILAEYGVYDVTLTKGEASDMFASLSSLLRKPP